MRIIDSRQVGPGSSDNVPARDTSVSRRLSNRGRDDSYSTTRLGRGLTTAIGLLAGLQGLTSVAGRTGAAPAPAPGPFALPAGQALPGRPGYELLATTAPVVSRYEHCAVQLPDNKFMCMQGLPQDMVQDLVPNTVGITCANFAEAVWSIENDGNTVPYAFSDIIQFEVPETKECCVIYQSDDPRGCLNLQPQTTNACALKTRACTSLGYGAMADIVNGMTPPASNGAGYCHETDQGFDCITETNVYVPKNGTTPIGGGGGTVQVTSGCSVNSATGSLSGNCALDPTDTLGG